MEFPSKYRIAAGTSELSGTVRVGGSKSISARALVIRALSEQPFEIDNLSEAKDTKVLQKLLQLQDPKLNAEDGGTTFRFMSALLASRAGEWELTGTERMKQRPIGILVDALRELGADIAYLENEGYPPLKIQGGELAGGKLVIDASVSSQFLSALLLIAPTMKKGLLLEWQNQLVSASYLHMTLRVMKQFGIEHKLTAHGVEIPPQRYQPAHFVVEEDWSTASYFFEMAAFSSGADILLQDLSFDSMQGDEKIHEMMLPLGIEVEQEKGGLRLKKQEANIHFLSFNVKDVPDLTPTLAVTCGGLGIETMLTGVEHLKYKETNRLVALQNELAKIHCKMELGQEGSIELFPFAGDVSAEFTFATYKDHRMAMAFAPLALPFNKIDIEQPGVVTKSYPHYWAAMESLGFNITSIP